MWSKRSEWLITSSPFFWLLLFFLIPTLIVIAFSFKPSELYGGIGSGWTLETIGKIFTRSTARLLFRSTWIAISVTALCLFLSLPVGYYIGSLRGWRKHFMLLLIIIPFWSSFIIRIFAWKQLLHPEGFFHKILVNLNLIQPDATLLYTTSTVILVMVYSYLPFAILPIYASASKFDHHLLEAAYDLGMGKLKAFFMIFIPSIKNGIYSATLLVLIPAIGAYVIPDMVGGTHSMMIGNKIAEATFIERNIPFASALSTLMMSVVLLPLLLAAILQNRQDKAHAIKGGH